MLIAPSIFSEAQLMIERTEHEKSLHLGWAALTHFLARGLARVHHVGKAVPLSHLMNT